MTDRARGERLDRRTGLVVLYEMATGRQPFAGGASAVIFNQILEHQPAIPRPANFSAAERPRRGSAKVPCVGHPSLRATL